MSTTARPPVTERAPESVTVQRDIPFHEVDGETLTLDLYDAAAASGPKPVAVLVRGGAFTSATRVSSPGTRLTSPRTAFWSSSRSIGSHRSGRFRRRS